MNKDFFKKIFAKIKIEYILVIILAIVGIILLISNINSNDYESTIDENEYVENLENKLSKNLSKLHNAGEVSVIISIEGGSEDVLATEKKISDGSVYETPLLVGGKTVVLSTNYPKIIGVVILCKGADSLSVRADLINATKTFLNIDESKIQVLKSK